MEKSTFASMAVCEIMHALFDFALPLAALAKPETVVSSPVAQLAKPTPEIVNSAGGSAKPLASLARGGFCWVIEKKPPKSGKIAQIF